MDDLDQFILEGGRLSGAPALHFEGNLTRDPHLRYLPNGAATCDFGIESQDPKWDPHPYILNWGITYETFLCKAYGQTAEIIHNYYRKGSQINISGSTGERNKYTHILTSYTINGQSGSTR